MALNTSEVHRPQTETARKTKHIAVCLCTHKRPDLLKKLLHELDVQDTAGLFTYSIVVVDNDRLQSAESVVADFAANSKVSVKYYVEPKQNIALARNKTRPSLVVEGSARLECGSIVTNARISCARECCAPPLWRR